MIPDVLIDELLEALLAVSIAEGLDDMYREGYVDGIKHALKTIRQHR